MRPINSDKTVEQVRIDFRESIMLADEAQKIARDIRLEHAEKFNTKAIGPKEPTIAESLHGEILAVVRKATHGNWSAEAVTTEIIHIGGERGDKILHPFVELIGPKKW